MGRDQEDPSPSLVLGLLTAGALTGVGVANWLTVTPADAKAPVRTGAGPRRVHFDPTALAMVMRRVPGQHALVSITF